MIMSTTKSAALDAAELVIELAEHHPRRIYQEEAAPFIQALGGNPGMAGVDCPASVCLYIAALMVARLEANQ